MSHLLLLVLLLFGPAKAYAAERPNIVLILADDMGYGDVHALNPKSKIATPHLDRLAAAGMAFIDAHTPSAVCTPTRYGVLTGRYCWRGRLKRGVINGYGARVIEPKTVVQKQQPFPAFLRRGPRANDFVMEDALDDLAKQATDYIRAQAKTEKPFFLYFPLSAPHKPTLPHKRFRGKSGLADYGDFVVQVDATVGKVLEAIDAAGIADNTIVIYTSDNGSYMYRYDDPDKRDHTDESKIQGYRAENHMANGPWRGTKADIYEAGHHVPFFVRWPGKVAKGSTCETTICLTDFIATFAELTGQSLPEDMGEDSWSVLALLRGERPSSPRPPVIHHSGSGMFAIRVGNWKLIAGNGSGGRERPPGKPFAEPFQLYDLSRDRGESENVISQQPELAAKLRAQLDEIRTSGRSVSRKR